MTTIQDILSMIQLGQTTEAETVLRETLETDPQNHTLNHLYGLVKLKTGHPIEAAHHLGIAAQADTVPVTVWIALGTAYLTTQRHAEATTAFQNAVSTDPENVSALLSLARTHVAVQDWTAAAAVYETLLSFAPDNMDARLELADTLHNQNQPQAALHHLHLAHSQQPNQILPALKAGFLHLQLDEIAEAKRLLTDAQTIDPMNLLANFGLGSIAMRSQDWETAREALCKANAEAPAHKESAEAYATVLMRLERWEEALSVLNVLLRQMPDNSAVLRDIGWCDVQLGDRQMGIEKLERAFLDSPTDDTARRYLAIALSEDKQFKAASELFAPLIANTQDSSLLYNAALTLHRQWRTNEAIELYKRALAIDPNNAQLLNNLGAAVHVDGNPKAAIEFFDQAFALNPYGSDILVNKAYALLLQGNFEDGWPLFEARWGLDRHPRPELDAPVWSGTPDPDGHLLVYLEQGMGDALQFVRYIPQVIERIPNSTLVVHKPLVPLLTGQWPGVSVLANGSEVGPFTTHIPLMSLPHVMGTHTVNQIPAVVPYLKAQDTLIDDWREALNAELDADRPRIGVVWAGSPTNLNDHHRSIPVAQMAQHFADVDVNWIGLQVGQTQDLIASNDGAWPMLQVGPRLRSFADTAAVMQHLDLIVSVDSAPLHLAGALNIPVWGLIPKAPDFRWLLDRTDNPWYPSLTLYRQSEANNWDTPLHQVKQDLLTRF